MLKDKIELKMCKDCKETKSIDDYYKGCLRCKKCQNKRKRAKKICNACNKELEYKQFTKNKSTKDGFSYYCRNCDRKKRQKDPANEKKLSTAELNNSSVEFQLEYDYEEKEIRQHEDETILNNQIHITSFHENIIEDLNVYEINNDYLVAVHYNGKMMIQHKTKDKIELMTKLNILSFLHKNRGIK